MILFKIDMLNFVVDEEGAIDVRQTVVSLPNVFIMYSLIQRCRYCVRC